MAGLSSIQELYKGPGRSDLLQQVNADLPEFIKDDEENLLFDSKFADLKRMPPAPPEGFDDKK